MSKKKKQTPADIAAEAKVKKLLLDDGRWRKVYPNLAGMGDPENDQCKGFLEWSNISRKKTKAELSLEHDYYVCEPRDFTNPDCDALLRIIGNGKEEIGYKMSLVARAHEDDDLDALMKRMGLGKMEATAIIYIPEQVMHNLRRRLRGQDGIALAE